MWFIEYFTLWLNVWCFSNVVIHEIMAHLAISDFLYLMKYGNICFANLLSCLQYCG